MADQVRDYDDIPGTFVFDHRRSRVGYQLNMFCMSLNQADNRAAFQAAPDAYLDGFELTTAQRTAVIERDWLAMLELGGNIYYTMKIAMMDGYKRVSQEVGFRMTGQTFEEFCQMMDDGGRNIEGNRYQHEWDARRNAKASAQDG